MKRGFSLIELLTVIALIGILAGIITVNVSSGRAKARDAKRQADVSAVSAALEMYYAKNKIYPTTAGGWTWNTLSVLEPYISNIPNDPQNPQSNEAVFGKGYVYCSDGARYAVDATLEGSSTADVISIGNPSACPSSSVDFYQTGTYNYGGKNHYRISGK